MEGSKCQIVEVKGDLFSVGDHVALAHCVSADLAMGKGIARIFRDKFKNVDNLKNQCQSTGGCAYLKQNNRYVFYLITKERYYEKPTYRSLSSSLRKMKELMQIHNVRELAIPHIGCGLDRLNWEIVKSLIQTIFSDCEITIRIFEL